MKTIKRYKLDGEEIEIEDTDRRRRWADGKGFIYEMDPTTPEAIKAAKDESDKARAASEKAKAEAAEKIKPKPAPRPSEA